MLARVLARFLLMFTFGYLIGALVIVPWLNK